MAAKPNPQLGQGRPAATPQGGTEKDSYYALSGTPEQMAVQANHLRGQGTKIVVVHGRPNVTSQLDYIAALGIIWRLRLPGWFHYKQDMVEFHACTEVDFYAAMAELTGPITVA